MSDWGDFAKQLRHAATEEKGVLEAVFDEEPVSLTIFVQDKGYLGNPPLSPYQYEAVRHIERIYLPHTYRQLSDEFEAHKQHNRTHIGPYTHWADEPYWSLPVRMTNFITLQWGKGSGKDHICRVASMRIAYLLMCLHSPQDYFGMPSQDTIHLLNVASSSGQAQQAFFMPIVRTVKKGWFAGKCQPRQNVISYEKGVESISGHSDAESQEGLNLLLGIADEIDAFKSKKEMSFRKGASAREPTKSAEGILNMMRTSGAPQPLDALVLTSDRGFVRMGELCLGDSVVDPVDGFASSVVAIYPQGRLPVFRLTFSDGTSAEATGEHLWQMNKLRSPRTLAERAEKATHLRTELWTTDAMADHLLTPHYAQKPLSLPETVLHEVDLGNGSELPIDPYLLGLLIGDGGLTHYTPTFTTSDDELRERCEQALPPAVEMSYAGTRSDGCHSYRLVHGKGRRNPLTEALREMGLWGRYSWNKFIPTGYLLASAKDRLALLRGLMDTDGHAGAGTASEFVSVSQRLRDDVAWLARSLGLRARCSDKPASSSSKGQRHIYRVGIRETDEVRIFALTRKTSRYRSVKSSRRTLKSIEYVRDAECQCIEVSAPSHLYVTDDFIPTHNTRYPQVFKQVRISYPRYLGSTIQQLTDEGRADMDARGIDSRHFVSGPLATWEVNPRVPGKHSFQQDYLEDPIMARAKYECKPARAINPFFRNPQALDACFQNRLHMPVEIGYRVEAATARRVWVPTYKFADNFFPIRGAVYAMHADMAISGDRAGIAMAHVASYSEHEAIAEDEDGATHTLREVRPNVKVDFCVSYSADISAEPAREIQIRWARQLCFELIRRGFSILRFTFDGFQSSDSMQILESKGIDTDKVSTDLSGDAWRTMRDLAYEGRLTIPAPLGFDDPHEPVPFLLRDELRSLTKMPNGRIDHPSDGSKDEADAVACAILGAVQIGGREDDAGSRAYFATPDFAVGRSFDLPFDMTPRSLFESFQPGSLP